MPGRAVRGSTALSAGVLSGVELGFEIVPTLVGAKVRMSRNHVAGHTLRPADAPIKPTKPPFLHPLRLHTPVLPSGPLVSATLAGWRPPSMRSVPHSQHKACCLSVAALMTRPLPQSFAPNPA